jgi:hypothetical protein
MTANTIAFIGFGIAVLVGAVFIARQVRQERRLRRHLTNEELETLSKRRIERLTEEARFTTHNSVH